MDYQDFVLQLDRAPGQQGFLTRVLRSPGGEAEAPFVNPIAPAELDNLWQAAVRTRQAKRDLGASTLGSRPRDTITAEFSLEDLGDKLFKALFQGPVRSCWVRSLAESDRSSDAGLRLKLQLNLADPLLTQLAELPWEYLFSLEHGGFLGLQRKTPVVRHVRLPLPLGKAPAVQPLRLLIVSSQPTGMEPLELEGESKRIASALRALPGVETLPLHNPSLEDLREALLQRDFHVIHFMGHGGFDPQSGQGVLYFTDKDQTALQVSGSLLGSHLAGFESLRLIFVNACQSARVRAQAPFAGVATALLRSGLTAVIAMQRPIRDDSALEFSRTVYHRLAAGDPIDAAVTEGRLAIARGQGLLAEWGTPVLFLRAENGQIFAHKPTLTVDTTTTPIRAETPLVLPAPHPQRSLLSFVLVAVLILGLGFGVAKWIGRSPGSPASVPTEREKVATEKWTLLPTTPIPEPTVPVLQETPSVKAFSGKHPSARREKSSVSQEAQATLTPRPIPATPTSYEVSDGNPVSIPSLGAEVGAHFFLRDGYNLARFWITRPDGEMMQQEGALLNPKSVDFPSPKGIYHLDVQSLDMAGKRAKVRLRFQPTSPM